MDRVDAGVDRAEDLEIGQAFRLVIEGVPYTVRREAEGFCTCVPKTCAFLWFNETGVEVMRLIGQGLNRDEIISEMCAATHLTREFWAEAVDAFIAYLV